MKHTKPTIQLLVAIGVLFFVSFSAEARENNVAWNVDYDTSRVRDPQPVEKTFGEAVADIPGEILKLPFRIVEGVTYTIATNPPVTTIASLVRFGQVARPYVPVVGFGSRSGLKLGFGYRHAGLFVDDIAKFRWYYSTHDYQSYQFTYSTGHRAPTPLMASVSFRYKKRPRERMFGLSNAAGNDNKASYTLENTEARLELPWQIDTHQIDKQIVISLSGGYQVTNWYDGRDPDIEGRLAVIQSDPRYNVRPGHFQPTRLFSFGASLSLDGRDDRVRPNRGYKLQGSYARFLGVDRSDGLLLQRWTIEAQQYVHLWRYRTLIFQVRLERLRHISGGSEAIPLNLLSQLGGYEGLKGYSRSRFLDNDLAYASVEYRYPIYDFMDAFVFFEEGRVYNDLFEEPFLARWKYSSGFGIRFWTPKSLLANVLIATSRESVQFYLELGIDL